MPLLLYVAFVLFPVPALAINWEGKDDWLNDSRPFGEVTVGVKPALVKPAPSCEERREARAKNAYEPEPVPGHNCIEKK